MKKWYQSANFYLALVLVSGGFFIGFPEDAAKSGIAALFALIPAAGTVYKFFKDKPANKGLAWFKDANFWNYASAIVLAVVPTYGPGLIEPVRQILESLIGKNWNGVIIGAISLATILIKIFKK